MRPAGFCSAFAIIFAASFAPAADDPAAEDLFERRVRPLLADHCWECHGPDVQENGLRLDSRAAVLNGGDRGPAVRPGFPDESLLVQAVRGSHDDLLMPPSEELEPEQVEHLVAWITGGVFWPETLAVDERLDAAERIANAQQNHWAFQPITDPKIPDVANEGWVQSPIDRFILARLESAGVEPSAEADRRTLIRRAYFDLLGLPPSPDEVDAFLSEWSPHAFTDLVDRLLERPEYGQRWGRHWLDVARYSDTTGYQEGAIDSYPFAHTYRDYVIRSFNEDTPFDQFLVEQLAADQLELSESEQWKLAGMGLLTLGPRFNYNVHEVIDDRIDVVTRGLLGLTVSCARCHDHKYDAILADDYYGLYGVLASSDEPNYADLPRLGSSRGSFSRYREFRDRVRRRRTALDQYEQEMYARIDRELRESVGDYLGYLVQAIPAHRTIEAKQLQEWRYGLRGPTPYGPGAIVRWSHYVENRGIGDPVFGLWNRLSQLPDEGFRENARQTLDDFSNLNPRLRDQFTEHAPESMEEVVEVYTRLLSKADEAWELRLKQDPEADSLTDPALEQFRQVLYAADSPLVFDADEAREMYRVDEFDRYMPLKRELDELFVEYADVAAPRAMVLVDRSTPKEPHVFARGTSTRPKRRVPRRFLRVLSMVDAEPFSQGSGRKELARAIASPENPLTARVIVNRVWQWHFGRGLVETPSDFGVRGAAPSHPELLDYLARRFIEEGWSVKSLHLRIMSSAVYRQSSLDRPEIMELDPDNRLLARMHRRRLGFESMRDAVLAVSGRLETRPIEYAEDDLHAPVRSVYLRVDRRDISGARGAFDFPSPEFSAGARPETTSPQQSLFFLNNPFIEQAVDQLVTRLQSEVSGQPYADACAAWLHRRLFGRVATEGELALAREFLQHAPEETLYEYAQVLLMSNEFMFVD